MPAKKKAPWKSPNPKAKSNHTKLNASQKTAARKRAAKAGRPYPNLVDNLWAARQSSRTRRKKSA
ncbi:MAG TPA: hypothetical protein VJM11_09505 [Nevskiaceae bacterium]|nr:hypothetical protein [Nevskiaceae bacterium]